MTRTEAREIADKLLPQGFIFNELTLHNGVWIASYIDNSQPPRVIIERWADFYTENDPEPTDTEDTTDGNTDPDTDVSRTGGSDTNPDGNGSHLRVIDTQPQG